MVQMTHARIYFPANGRYAAKEITAKDYAKKKDEMIAREEAGEIECHCPDPHCDGVRVSMRAEHLHTYYGKPAEGEEPRPYRLEIENYFARRPGAAEHDPKCNIVKEYAGYRRIVASLSELRTGHQSFRINLNIPSHDLAPPRRSVKVETAFRDAAESDYRKASDRPRRPPISHSMSSIHGLGSLIERAVYDDQLQRNTMIHVDGRILALREFYRETPVEMFEAGRDAIAYGTRIARRQVSSAFFPAATVFRPVLPGKFWVIDKKEGPGQIFGQADKVRGRDGKSYNVCTVLHVADRDLFFDLKAQFNKGYESFLVVSEKNHIDLDEIRQRNEESKTTKVNTAFHVHTYVNLPVQITPWTPPPDIKEMDFGGGMFDLREPPHQKQWREQQKAKRDATRSVERDAANEAQAQFRFN